MYILGGIGHVIQSIAEKKQVSEICLIHIFNIFSQKGKKK